MYVSLEVVIQCPSQPFHGARLFPAWQESTKRLQNVPYSLSKEEKAPNRSKARRNVFSKSTSQGEALAKRDPAARTPGKLISPY